MKKRSFIALLVVLAFVVPASAVAGNGNKAPAPTTPTTTVTVVSGSAHATTGPIATKPPIGYVVCGGSCDGGGGPPPSGCATVQAETDDGYGNKLFANYHWCWSYGSISNTSGWGDYSTCSFFCSFGGYHYDYSFNYGHRDKATFTDVNAGFWSITDDITTGVCVDGWGNAWAC